MDALKDRLLERVEEVSEEAVELLADMVKAQSFNPPGDTRKITELIVRKAEAITDHCEVVAVEDSAPNVFVTLNPGARPQLLYNGHLDTVPAGDASQWEVDPFGAVVRGNLMYGRGVADMKGGCAAMLMAAKVLAMEQVPLKGSLVVNLVSDEETGGRRGAGYLMEKGFYSPDMVVVGEITNGNGIAISEKGVVIYSLTTKGRSAHASTPWVGVNAIEKMVKILDRIQVRLKEALKTRPSGSLPPATINFGTIQGGVSFNVVADSCNALIDRRILPDETVESATREIQDIIDQIKVEDPEIDAALEILGSGAPFETSPNASICKLAKQTLEELGLPSEFVAYEQVSDGRFFAEKGIPTILIGPGIAKVAHAPNERLELDQFLDSIRIYALLAARALA